MSPVETLIIAVTIMTVSILMMIIATSLPTNKARQIAYGIGFVLCVVGFLMLMSSAACVIVTIFVLIVVGIPAAISVGYQA